MSKSFAKTIKFLVQFTSTTRLSTNCRTCLLLKCKTLTITQPFYMKLTLFSREFNLEGIWWSQAR